jgi:hypothetical protein
MARRDTHRFLGNKKSMEVHDLDKEQTGANQCQINEIIRAGNTVYFDPYTFAEARSKGYDPCDHCIGGSKR